MRLPAGVLSRRQGAEAGGSGLGGRARCFCATREQKTRLSRRLERGVQGQG